MNEVARQTHSAPAASGQILRCNHAESGVAAALCHRTPYRAACLVALWVCLVAGQILAAPAPLLDTARSPHAKLQPASLDEVRWTEGFWAQRFESCRAQMLPAMWELMSGTNRSHYLENFRIAAALAEGRPRGAPFNDGDFYKLLEASCASLAVAPDRELEQRVEEAIAVIAKAQRADGYLHTPVFIRARQGDTNAVAFRDRNNFEMYNFGHLMTAACVHQRVTGRTNFLGVARRAADFLDATFRGASPEVARSSVCPSHYMGMVELFRATREPRYLALAQKFFALRSQITDGGDDNQDRIPFAQQTNAVGHAVRANYLFAGAADLYMETGDPALWRTLGAVWTNVVTRKLYLTGACGALYDGASPDGSRDQKSITRTHQAYGRDFQLPNTTAHAETCANIGNVLWNWRMFLATGEARFVDVLELSLYNSVLSGVGLAGTNYFYTNPLRVTEPMPVALRWSRQRVPFVSSFCCPPNVVRMVAEVNGLAYAKSSGALWVNLYGGSEWRTEVAPGVFVKLAQETAYPWNGRVRLAVSPSKAAEFSVKLRIPGWAKSATIRVNNLPLADAPQPGTYFTLHRSWQPGDVVDLDFPMPAVLVEANPLVEETLNQVAVKRGPVVYCVESADLKGARVTELALAANTDLVARFDQRLLGGVAVVDALLTVRSSGDWDGKLFRELTPRVSKPVKVQFVPYFTWANRGTGEMSVWLPVETK
ncbi:MAG: glycoside hydrolase family 127 protein [Pedosphaera sp.]|nr:glycoside hydrolase family 127 protein [Pedosphaera sp.]